MPHGDLQRLRLTVTGAVQGVGFRPFVFRLADRLGLSGWIANDPSGVVLEVEGGEHVLAEFAGALQMEAPPLARIQSLAARLVPVQGSAGFRIAESDAAGERSTVVLPDVATCADCLADVREPGGRRQSYAFTNCTNCGPRYSIIRGLPYDRPLTTMAGFTMCPECAAEYGDPYDRRFHAQPNACPRCGPQLAVLDCYGASVVVDDPLQAAADALRAGEIVAVKGLGGFHLMVDATSEAGVEALRRRKRRPTKPLAIMAASAADAARFVIVPPEAVALLESPEAPIVLLQRRPQAIATAGGTWRIPENVAPRNPTIGVMLPATPLHHRLLELCGVPLVATSGNLSEEPICIDEREAVVRLAGIADLYLTHNRPIERHVDDSVADILDGAPRLLRRARGYAPLPVLAPQALPTVLAVGAHMKNAVALTRGRQVFISQHIGDLDAGESRQAFERVAADLLRLYEATPVAVAHDLHPDYAATAWARQFASASGVPAIPVQHHHAHLVSCMAENGETEPTLGVVWDGTGLGTDGTIWGGEFLLGDAASFERVAHLAPFRLPGGDAAVREPRRVAAALLHEAFGADAAAHDAFIALGGYSPSQRVTLVRMIERGLNAPLTSSAGRLLDGIAALLGICGVSTFEGEAAIRLEHAADPDDGSAYHIPFHSGGAGKPVLLDWRPLVRDVVHDSRRGVAVASVAARVHNALVHAAAVQAELAGCDRVALTGGCFQNRILSQRLAAELRRRGFQVLAHRVVPPNDGGIALGQAVAAAALLTTKPGAMGSIITSTSSV
jgi:hydrogenase maturation protein HypF